LASYSLAWVLPAILIFVLFNGLYFKKNIIR
jgi:hypothetical protein